MRSLARLGNAFQSMQARACCRRRCTLLLTEVLGVSGPPSSTSILFWQVALNVFNAITSVHRVRDSRHASKAPAIGFGHVSNLMGEEIAKDCPLLMTAELTTVLCRL